MTWRDVALGTLSLALPQVPLTPGNAIIAVTEENNRPFPERPVSERKVSISTGILNLLNHTIPTVRACGFDQYLSARLSTPVSEDPGSPAFRHIGRNRQNARARLRVGHCRVQCVGVRPNRRARSKAEIDAARRLIGEVDPGKPARTLEQKARIVLRRK